MRLDLYSKVVLTIIAACLVVITIHAGSLIPVAKAAGYTTCTGQLTANAYGGQAAMVGGYQVLINCNQ